MTEINLVNGLIAFAGTVLGGGGAAALYQSLFNRGGQRAETASKLAEAQAKEHETWFEEAREAYKQAKQECVECKQELEKAERDHRHEVERIRAEFTSVKEALVKRLDAFDELLAYVKDVPPEKLAEFRKSNQVARYAVLRANI